MVILCLFGHLQNGYGMGQGGYLSLESATVLEKVLLGGSKL
jgi:hypothetical protein